MRRHLRRPFHPRRRFPIIAPPMVITFLAAVLLFVRLSARLEPLIETIAVSNAINAISIAVSGAAADALTECGSGYRNFVDVSTDSNGRVTALSFRTAEGSVFKQTFISLLCDRI